MGAPNLPSQGAARLSESPLKLVAQAIGGRHAVVGKVARLIQGLADYGSGGDVEGKMLRLRALGIIDQIPTRTQLAVGGIDMLRFWISPAAADYYEERGISYSFHQLLRFLDEPASLIDPVGFFSTEDGIIGHVMQVVHANPVYDLQLLAVFDGGVDNLVRQLREMVAGTHARAGSIGAIVEEPDYHERLLEFVLAWRRDPTITPLLRSNVVAKTELSTIERTFGSLTGAMRYFNRMPRSPLAGAIHVLTNRTFPQHLGEK